MSQRLYLLHALILLALLLSLALVRTAHGQTMGEYGGITGGAAAEKGEFGSSLDAGPPSDLGASQDLKPDEQDLRPDTENSNDFKPEDMGAAPESSGDDSQSNDFKPQFDPD
ncbi:MAG TPA: hypothetical protein VEC38_05470 [Candidatus Binataceae bacterium]|nr:hypothetical protein [Candidatus Binataceae bacterium]